MISWCQDADRDMGGAWMSDHHIGTMRPHTERVYVEVSARFDSTGYMQPVAVTWSDGRTFPINKVRDFRPAGMMGNDLSVDCFTVLIQGKEKLLFFEHIDPRFTGRLGRWFVEKMQSL